MGSPSPLYEDIAPSWPAELPIRPGGLALTERALSYCAFSSGDRLLDVGCGTAVTLEYLTCLHGYRAFGVDPSPSLLRRGTGRKQELPVVLGNGEDLPFSASLLDGVFLECSLSVSCNPDQVLRECSRVLKQQGKLILSDVFLNGKQNSACDAGGFLSRCTAGAMPGETIAQLLRSHGFEIRLWEDHSSTIGVFLAQLIFFCDFNPVRHTDFTGEDCGGRSQVTPKHVYSGHGVGYFLLVAEKTGDRQD